MRIKSQKMKKLFFAFFLLLNFNSFSQAWNFVGTESFTPEGCSSLKIAKYDWGGIVCVADPWDGSTRYVHPYIFDGTDWDTLYDVIHHNAFITYDLWPDIEMNSTNEYFIYTFGGPNKSYLYQSFIGTQSWDLVDSVDVDHVDLETGQGGDVWMSGYGNIYDHHLGTGSHTTYAFPSLMSFNPITVNNLDEPLSFHATNSFAFEVNHLTGGSYSELDSLNYGAMTTNFDIEMSQNQPVTVHLDPNSGEIMLKKYNGATWDQVTVNAGTTYNVSEVSFNLGIEAGSGDIIVGVHHFTTTSGPTTTTNTIDVFKVSADLMTETSLGTAASFTYLGGGFIGKYDVEVFNNVAYVGYVNVEDSSKASVKSYDLSTAAIDNSAKSIQFNLYPNPAKDQLFIQTELSVYNLEILDISGKVVLQQNVSGENSIGLSEFSAGVYFVKISNQENISSTKKLIIR